MKASATGELRSPDVALMTVITGDDGRARCSWSGHDDEYRRYHDEEWGFALHGDQALFEKLSLEGFQAGLSWITILRRRPAFRELFHGFALQRVAAMSQAETDALMDDARIIRNRAKIEATISNARLALELTASNVGALDELLWSFAPAPRPAGVPPDLAALTPESTALSTALRALGFRFVGPTTMYALMQSSGMVNDHDLQCWRVTERYAGGAGGRA